MLSTDGGLHLTRPVRLAGAVVLAAALFGLYNSLVTFSGILSGAAQPELAAREAAWGPVYGFAVACGGKVHAGASVLLVDPTDTPQPSYPGAPRDADWNDQDHFAYALAPRRTAVLGHPPPGWDPATGGQGYVAVWQQKPWRTEAARASAADAVGTLASSPRASLVCQYGDDSGDRGWLYAISPVTAASGPPLEVRSPLHWGDYPLAIVGLACLWVIGFVLLRLLAGAHLAAGVTAALSLPLGAFAAASELLVFSAARLAWSLPLLMLPWLVATGVVAWRERRAIVALIRDGRGWSRGLSAWRSLPGDQRLALGAIVGIVAAVTLIAPLSLPYSDGINFYYLKAKVFALDGSVVPFQSWAHLMPWSAPRHPPLVPLCVVWLYLFVGGVAEHSSFLFWPAMLASLLALFFALVKTKLPGRAAAWCTLAFSIIASGITSSAMLGSYADLPLAVFLLAGGGLLAVWLASDRRDPRLPAVAGLFLAAAVLTKEEGLVLACVVVLAFAATLLYRQARRAKVAQLGMHLVILVAVFAFASLPLLWLRLGYPQPELTVSGNLSPEKLPWTASVTLIGLAGRALLRWFAVLAVVGAVAAAIGWNRRRLLELLDRGIWLIVLTTAGAGAVYWAAMITDPLDTVAELSHTSGRLLDQILPLPFLAGSWLIAAAVAAGAPLLQTTGPKVERPPEVIRVR